MWRAIKKSAKARAKWAAVLAMCLAATEAVAQEQRVGATARGVAASQPERKIVISLSERRLALIQNGRLVKAYAVAVAPESPSPAGEFRIAHRITEPAYYAPGKVIPPGKDNPLGTRWLGLNQKGYGIHGTNEPRSIGRRASHGCIRMRNRDVQELFEMVRVGDVVELHAELTADLEQIFGTTAAGAAGGQD